MMGECVVAGSVFRTDPALLCFSLWRGLLLLFLSLCQSLGLDLLTNYVLLLRRQQLENLTVLHAPVPIEHRPLLLRVQSRVFVHNSHTRLRIPMNLVNFRFLVIRERQPGKIVRWGGVFLRSSRR